MNRAVLTACLLFFSVFIVRVAAETILPDSSVLIPKDVYVGDRAELRCTINTSVSLLSDDIDSDSYIPDSALFARMTDSCTVEKIVLQKLPSGYSLSVFFIPWKPGVLTFPPIDLTVFPAVRNMVSENTDFNFQIELGSVTVSSIAAKMNETKLRPSAAPVIIPGTTYLIYAVAILILAVLIVIVIVLIRLKSVLLFWRNQGTKRRLFMNYRGTLSKIKKLKRAGLDSAEFAAELELILRTYLEKRFAYPFQAVVPSEIPAAFDLLSGGTLESFQLEAVELLCGIFQRCDYIRFSPDVQQTTSDPEQLTADVQRCLHIFEKGDA